MRIQSIKRFISICMVCSLMIAAFPLTRVSAFGDHLDDTFDGNGKLATDFVDGADVGRAVAIQADGKIVVAGESNGEVAISRYNPNGSLDMTFSGDGRVTGPAGRATAVAIQPDGKIVIAGSTPGGPTTFFQVARYTTLGAPDFSFNGGTATAEFTGFGMNQAFATSLAIQPDGYIVVAGYRLTLSPDTTSTHEDWAVARFAPSGLLDPLFSGDGRETVFFENPTIQPERATAVTILGDGKILIGGVASPSSNRNFAFARFTTTGTPDNTFDTDGKVSVDFGASEGLNAMKIQPDGKIVAAGYSGSHFAVARFSAAAVPDTSFDLDGIALTNINPGGTDVANAMVIQSDGKIVLAGTKKTGTNPGDFVLARYMPTGALDPTFGQSGIVTTDMNNNSNDAANALALQADGKLVAAGFTRNTAATHDDFVVARYLPNAGNTFFDFDGDDRTDISIFRPGNGQWWIQRSSGQGTFAAQFGAGSDRIAPADFTGDGRTDIAVWRPSTGTWYILRSEDFAFYAFPFGTVGDIPAPADYDADGRADATVFRPEHGTWYTLRASNGEVLVRQFGANGDVPVVADYDADGRADLAIYRPSVGQWWVNRSTVGLVALTFGDSADKPTQGDFTGDGRADIAFWRPSNGSWYVLRSEDFLFYAFPFGTNGDIPVAGDYDNDGKVDAAVVRPSNATWYIQRSTAGLYIQQFGSPSDRPVPNAYVP